MDTQLISGTGIFFHNITTVNYHSSILKTHQRYSLMKILDADLMFNSCVIDKDVKKLPA